MPKNVEDDILAMVDDGSDGGETNANVSDGEGGETNTGIEDTESTRSSPINTNANASTSQSNDSQPGKKPAGPKPLTDRDGNVIAEGGRERRFYEAAQTAKAESTRLQGELNTALAKIQAYESASSIATQLKLSPDEAIQGQKIMAAFKVNPVETIKYLLTEAQAAGHNTTEIGGGGLSAEAIKQMIAEEFKPLREDRERVKQSQEVESRAVNEYNSFIKRFPDAKVHESTIARMLQDDDSLSPDAAYYKLRAFYLEKQLDWSKSFEVLADEMEKAKAGKQPMNDTRSPGLPGRGTNSATAGTKNEIADVDASTSDIVKSAMREAGIQI